MKRIIAFAALVLALGSCKKEVPVPKQPAPSSFSKDSSFADQYESAPKPGVRLYRFVFKTGDVAEGAITGITVNFKTATGAQANTLVRNLYSAITGPNMNFSSANAAIGRNMIGGQFSIQSANQYFFEGHADVLSGASDKEIIATMTITYQYLDNGSMTQKTLTAEGQKISFTTGAVVLSVSANSPKGVVLPTGDKAVTFTGTAMAVGLESMLDAIEITAQDPNVVTGYEVKIGTAVRTVQSTGASTSVDLSAAAIELSATPKVVTITSILAKDAGAGANARIAITSYSSTTILTGQKKTVTDSVKAGNDVYIVRSKVSYNQVLLTGMLVPDTEAVLARGELETVGGESRHKKFSWAVNVKKSQGGSYNPYDTLLRFVIAGTDYTSKGMFLDQTGAVITKITESTTRVIFVWTAGSGEYVHPVGKSTVELLVTPKDFKTSGDLHSATILVDGVLPKQGHNTLSPGNGSDVNLNSTRAKSSASSPASFIYSDGSAIAHSGALAVSSNDWMNGAFIVSAQSGTKALTQFYYVQ